jgi:hypothetical protein
MAQTITQTNTTRRTNRTRSQAQVRRASQANTSSTSSARSSDGVSMSTRAQAAMAADRVRDVMSGLGFSVGGSTGTARTAPRRGSESSGFGRARTGVSARGSANGNITESRRQPSAGQRALEILDTASILNPVTAPLTIGRRLGTLVGVETGLLNPDSSSRLGAYQATAGNERGTTGRAAHNSIGGIYLLLGNFGQDRIGDVFNSSEARELYDQSLSNGSSRQLAETEHGYWENQRRTQGSAGGYMGSAFSPAARDMIQQVMGRI